MTITANPPVELPLENLNPAQKWAVVQYLWTDLVENHNKTIEAPAWHEAELKRREQKEVEGKAVWHDLDDAFEIIKSRCK